MSLENGLRDVLERSTGLQVGTLYPYADPQYRHPSPADVRAVLAYGELSSESAAKIVGVTGRRTIGKWASGQRKIPYAAWRLLLIHVGLA